MSVSSDFAMYADLNPPAERKAATEPDNQDEPEPEFEDGRYPEEEPGWFLDCLCFFSSVLFSNCIISNR